MVPVSPGFRICNMGASHPYSWVITVTATGSVCAAESGSRAAGLARGPACDTLGLGVPGTTAGVPLHLNALVEAGQAEERRKSPARAPPPPPAAPGQQRCVTQCDFIDSLGLADLLGCQLRNAMA